MSSTGWTGWLHGPRCCASRWWTPGWPPAATPASTVRTTRGSPAGPGSRASGTSAASDGSETTRLAGSRASGTSAASDGSETTRLAGPFGRESPKQPDRCRQCNTVLAMAHQQSPGRPGGTAVSLLSGVLVASACLPGVPSAGAAPPDNVKSAVRYELTGAGVAEYVTYQTDTGQLHAVNVPLPWAMQVSRWADVPNYSASFSVSAHTAGPGSITCVIRVEGKVVNRNTATGDPARVFCENHGGRTKAQQPATGEVTSS